MCVRDTHHVISFRFVSFKFECSPLVSKAHQPPEFFRIAFRQTVRNHKAMYPPPCCLSVVFESILDRFRFVFNTLSGGVKGSLHSCLLVLQFQ